MLELRYKLIAETKFSYSSRVFDKFPASQLIVEHGLYPTVFTFIKFYHQIWLAFIYS